MATESELRYNAAHFLDAYKGCAEGGTLHKKLIDMFNDSGLCTRYKVTYSDAWCAVAVSDCFIGTGLTSIFPCIECGCANMITKASSAGIWVENDAYVPGIGDVVLYDWQDSGSGDNTGTPDHVGIVQSVSGSSFVVIEGNKSDTVGTRTMSVNGKYIRGFITPKYASAAGTTGSTAGGSMTEKADPATVWNYLYGKIGNAYGTAGVMGNMYAESSMIPINLQDSYEKKLGYTDKTYTEAVDNGTYTNFVNDSAGYGLVQWTYYTLKQGLLEYCQSMKASIGNMDAQLEFLVAELSVDFPSLWKTLQNATSVKEASDAMLTKFENPADQSDSVKEKRASYGQNYYDTYAKSSSSGTTSSDDDNFTYTATLNIDGEIGPKSVMRMQTVMGQKGKKNVDGYIDGQQSASQKYWTSVTSEACGWTGGSSPVVKLMQQYVKGFNPGTVDGKLGKKTAKAWQNFLISLGFSCGKAGADGKFGSNSAMALQNWLNTK